MRFNLKMKNQIILIFLYTLSFAFLFTACDQKEKEQEKLNKFQKIFVEGNYRQILQDYSKLIMELKDTTSINHAKEIYDKSKNIVNKTDSLIKKASQLNSIGINIVALKYAQEALNIFPKDSLAKKIMSDIPKDKTPKFKIEGTFRSARFEYVFHTIYKKEKLNPVSVDITVTNLSPYSATALAYFVPSFYYLEVNKSGPRFFVVVADYEKWSNEKQFNKPIYVNKSLTGTVNYSGARIERENTDMTLSKVFVEIIIGEDPRYYLNIAGTRNTRFSGLSFAGYE
ncbi:MAG: hypothetical protein WAR79_15145 [Melioribacteraceae bacterium]